MKTFTFITKNNYFIKRYLHTTILLFFIFCVNTTYSQIFINEFQASNNTSVPEIHDFEDYSDWLELYNDGSETINLSGYSITDDINNPEKWIIPNGTLISAKGFIHFWADGFDAIPNELHKRPWDWADPFITKFYHIPFKLNKEGEEIAIFDPQGKLVDHIIYKTQISDISYGRKPDGGNQWYFFGDPTPNKPNTTIGILNPVFSTTPFISPQGGFFNADTTISITSPISSKVLRYTLDGSFPTEKSSIYSSSIDLDSSTIIKSRSFESGILPSKDKTQSYIFDDQEFTLPIISITTDPKLLWNDTFGIYKHAIKERKIPIKFDYYLSKDNKVLSANASLRISGEWSFKYPQKSFTISSSSKYGDDYLNYSFFHNIDHNKFENIYLRNSGTPDNHLTMFRDAFCHTLVIDDMDIDAQAYQPAITYLNGKYWGIYNIREKIKNNYFTYNHNADPNNIDLLEYDANSIVYNGKIVVNEGDDNSYKQLLEFIENNSLANETNYNYVESKIDINEYQNFMITQIFIGNHNWITSNMKWWKEKNTSSKWRWILLDTDRAFGEEGNINYNSLPFLLGNSLQKWSYLQFKSLMANQKFKHEFIQRFAAHLNTTFRSERTIHVLDSLQEKISIAMVNHIERWNFQSNGNFYPIKNMGKWRKYVQAMRDFALERPEYQRDHIAQQFGLSDMFNLDLSESEEHGKILVNGVNIPRETMDTGKYFAYIPIRLEAIPMPGYKFISWKGISTENKISMLLWSDTTITAIFAPTDECIVLSEITEDMILDNSCDHYIALQDIVIHKNASLQINPGIEIRMNHSANILVHGDLKILGDKDLPVIIKPNSNIGTTTWGGIIFDNSTSPSLLQNLELIGATKGDNDKYIGAISGNNSDITLKNVKVNNVRRPFYSHQGKIHIDSCTFISTNTTDLINIKYADTAIIENCNLEGSNAIDADAIDLDGVSYGLIRNNNIHSFTGSNSDAIDLGESCDSIFIENNYINNIYDKGISIGQGSKGIIKRNVIIGCSQGIGIKDFGSYALIDKNTFYKNDYAVACFEKKIGNGGAKAKINNSILSSSSSFPIFIDDKSEISITYSLSDTKPMTGLGNINANPLFVDESQLNLELKPNSPCINSGDPNSPVDSDDTRTDMGASFVYQGSISNYTIVINEINYHSSDGERDSGDWIELYNYGDNDIDLSNWIFMDEKNSHKFNIPQGTILQSKEYLILSNNSDLFVSVYGYEIPVIGNFSFGLGNSGDIARIFDSNLKEIDFVKYDDKSPWSEFADGDGGSLILLDVKLDNSLVSSWYKKYGFPSPGKNNNTINVDFDNIHVNTCSGFFKFINKSSGPIDQWNWTINDKKTFNKFDNYHTYDSNGVDTITLELLANNNSFKISKVITFPIVLKTPIFENGFSCGPAKIELKTTKTHNTYWYYKKTSEDHFWIGKNFITKNLDLSKTYYVANAFSFSCTSTRIPIKAEVFDTVIAYFEYETDKNVVTFENKSRNSFTSIWEFGDSTTETNINNFVTHIYNKTGNYDVKLFTEGKWGECFDSTKAEITINILSQDNQSHNNTISIFPNPTSKSIYLEIAPIERAKIEIFDINGKVILSEMDCIINEQVPIKIDVENYPVGIYIMKIQTGNNIAVKRFLKY